jgi:hypothetical protein
VSATPAPTSTTRILAIADKNGFTAGYPSAHRLQHRHLVRRIGARQHPSLFRGVDVPLEPGMVFPAITARIQQVDGAVSETIMVTEKGPKCSEQSVASWFRSDARRQGG